MAENFEILDLRGIPCPANAAKALIKLATMDLGDKLRILLDSGEPLINVPSALQENGHRLLSEGMPESMGGCYIDVEVGS